MTKFYVLQQTRIDNMVLRIVDFLKSQPNFIATYDKVKAECNVVSQKTFKQLQLKKVCDTNLVSYQLI